MITATCGVASESEETEDDTGTGKNQVDSKTAIVPHRHQPAHPHASDH